MKTIIKQSADGIILSGDNNFDTKLRKVFINNHEITDIDTFFKVAEENTRLLEQVKKQKEVIDKAIEYIKNNLSLGVDTFGSVYSIGANEVLDILKEGTNNE